MPPRPERPAQGGRRRGKGVHALQTSSHVCLNPACDISFTPTRRDQVYHSPECHQEHYAAMFHACPDCGAVHRVKVAKRR